MMKEDVRVKIFTKRSLGEEDEIEEMIVSGKYEQSADLHTIRYDEFVDSPDEVIYNIFSIGADGMLVKKTGVLESEMQFCKEGGSKKAKYITPFGEHDMDVKTLRYELSDREDKIDVDLEYSLYIDKVFAFNTVMKINIEEKIK